MAPSRDPRVSQKSLTTYRGFIQVKVGQEKNQETFDVHESLITSRSLFFKKAMSGSWKGSEDRIVNLPEDDPDIFKIYVHHLYTGSVAVIPEPLSIDNTRSHTQGIICRLYVLAEKLQDIKAKNSAIEALIADFEVRQPNGARKTPGPYGTSIIYSGTLPGSMARKILVHICSRASNGKYITENTGWPDEFLKDLLVKVLDDRAVDNIKSTGINVADYLEPEENNTGA